MKTRQKEHAMHTVCTACWELYTVNTMSIPLGSRTRSTAGALGPSMWLFLIWATSPKETTILALIIILCLKKFFTTCVHILKCYSLVLPASDIYMTVILLHVFFCFWLLSFPTGGGPLGPHDALRVSISEAAPSGGGPGGFGMNSAVWGSSFLPPAPCPCVSSFRGYTQVWTCLVIG